MATINLAEVQEKNKRITENNLKINQALTVGAKAFAERNYDLAIEKFDEAISLDPNFWGSAPILLNNKAIALKTLGAEKYNNAIQTNLDPAVEANRFFLECVVAFKESLRILETSEIPSDEAAKKLVETTRFNAIKGLTDAYRLLVLTDQTRIYEAVEAFENYIKIEMDKVQKQKAQETLKQLKSKFKINY